MQNIALCVYANTPLCVYPYIALCVYAHFCFVCVCTGSLYAKTAFYVLARVILCVCKPCLCVCVRVCVCVCVCVCARAPKLVCKRMRVCFVCIPNLLCDIFWKQIWFAWAEYACVCMYVWMYVCMYMFACMYVLYLCMRVCMYTCFAGTYLGKSTYDHNSVKPWQIHPQIDDRVHHIFHIFITALTISCTNRS